MICSIKYRYFYLLFNLITIFSCQSNNSGFVSAANNNHHSKIILGGGCLGNLKTCFSQVKGIYQIIEGYSGGYIDYPSSGQVDSGTTGHSRVLQVEYNPEEISLSEILDIFWYIHNPLKKYDETHKSVIIFFTNDQKMVAQGAMKKSEDLGIWGGKYNTVIKSYSNFFVDQESEDKSDSCIYYGDSKQMYKKFKNRYKFKLVTE